MHDPMTQQKATLQDALKHCLRHPLGSIVEISCDGLRLRPPMRAASARVIAAWDAEIAAVLRAAGLEYLTTDYESAIVRARLPVDTHVALTDRSHP